VTRRLPEIPASASGAGSQAAALRVQGLTVAVRSTGIAIVEGLDLEVAEGEILGLAGESGSGKTTAGLAMLGHCKRGTRIAAGSVTVGGTDLLRYPPAELRRQRGRLISYVPQDPASALNPNLRVGLQLREVLETHRFGASDAERDARLAEMLDEVGLGAEADLKPGLLGRYPHQLSGGQQQRVAIAMAFACRPRVIVLDEPTTGLDVTTQTHVLATIRRLCAEHGVAAVYITHDLAVVAEIAQRVAILYAGDLLEVGPTARILSAPAHPYTEGLIKAAPDLEGRRLLAGIPGHAPDPARRPAGCRFAPRCAHVRDACTARLPDLDEVTPGHQVRCVRVRELALGVALSERAPAAAARAESESMLVVEGLRVAFGGRRVLEDVSLRVGAGRCVILLGESGSGKTTLARCVAGLLDRYSGTVRLQDTPLPAGYAHRSRAMLRAVQYVFQSPYNSLNPRKTVGESVAEPLRSLTDLDPRRHRDEVRRTLAQVSLRPELIDRYPDQLSGGERQRVAIARALAAGPKVLICDEVTSALDVSVQASIVELLRRLQAEMGLTLLFVTHNICLVRHVAQEVAVLRGGRIAELGAAEEVLSQPRDGYTRELLANTPRF
jgi:peptide/nickel transport system ATP-binding protein